MELISFVTVKGALKAITLYQEVFGAEIVGETTMLQSIKGFEDKKFDGMVGHMTVKIGTSTFFMNDFQESNPVTYGNQIQFVVNFETETSLKTAFSKLKKEGQVISELQEVFWGALFGTVKDKFGITWQIYAGHK